MQDEDSETQIGILGKFLLEILHWGAFPVKHFLGAATQARKRPILS